MRNRLKIAIDQLKRIGLDAFLITKPVNIKYLTGFPAEESWFVIGKKPIYLTDGRFTLQAQEGLKGITVSTYSLSLEAKFFEWAKELNYKKIGFDGRHLSHAQFKLLSRKCPAGIKLIDLENFIENFREIKDAVEIAKIRQALRIHQQVHNYIKKTIKPGMTEAGLCDCIDQFVKKLDVGYSFPPIVAAGTNSCYPHAKITNRKFRQNESILVDLGIDYQGYKSDLTRMFFLGKIPKLILEVNETVALAQKKAITAIKAGVTIAQIDHQARKFLEDCKLAQYFNHSLGHGVGLEIHENPRVFARNNHILKEGMVITVEPGVYIPGKFGIRIEDMVLVHKNKGEVLSERIH